MKEREVPRYKFALRKSWNFALASVAAGATMEEGICQDARIVLGGIATHPYRSREAESVLVGRKIDERLAQEAAEIALEKAKPRSAAPCWLWSLKRAFNYLGFEQAYACSCELRYVVPQLTADGARPMETIGSDPVRSATMNKA